MSGNVTLRPEKGLPTLTADAAFRFLLRALRGKEYRLLGGLAVSVPASVANALPKGVLDGIVRDDGKPARPAARKPAAAAKATPASAPAKAGQGQGATPAPAPAPSAKKAPAKKAPAKAPAKTTAPAKAAARSARR